MKQYLNSLIEKSEHIYFEFQTIKYPEKDISKKSLQIIYQIFAITKQPFEEVIVQSLIIELILRVASN